MGYKKKLYRLVFLITVLINVQINAQLSDFIYDAQDAKSLANTFTLTPQQLDMRARCRFDELFKAARLLKINGKNKDALELFAVCLSLYPFDWVSNWEIADLYGIRGDLKRLWKGQAFRWRYIKKFQNKLWRGEPLQNRTIVVHGIWGFGDTFQYVRYLKLLKQEVVTIIFSGQKALHKILNGCMHIDQFIDEPKEIMYDYQIPLPGLPERFNTKLESIPADIPYLYADPILINFWKTQLAKDKKFKIGICWHGEQRPDPLSDYRPIPLALIAQLADLPMVSLYSLQRTTSGIEQLKQDSKISIHQFDKNFDIINGSFMDTAAVMKNLDLVITIDTSIARLAGGLGVPVWVLLPFIAENRFFINRTDSPWYPTMRLFRQPKKGDWDSVINILIPSLRKNIAKQGVSKLSISYSGKKHIIEYSQEKQD